MRYVFTLSLIFNCFSSLAQTVQPIVNVSVTMPSVALIDLLSTGSFNPNLKVVAPTEAGNAVNTFASNSDNWLIFTSAVAAGASRSIKGNITGTLPGGLRLRLDISPYVGSGAFTPGSCFVTSNVYLTTTPTSFIDTIKGAYTGINAGSSGYKLKYSLEVQSYGNIRSGLTAITVQYTIADN
ncbi:hypothetical protein SAMN04487995_1843 [Dyadobacter koreensis]|uniref:Uncharacterized protein n=1 Tax=Dyadobacter koreensis TaxID=408657 RepID=A0A1H6SUG8_9BACT|nr:hypothetical protein [Dyadobacter koreensis]SEI71589.1 hypothetical protein SAMN04487995_1843 [Dyadobacter koreensis]